jgi:YegS/Rv2252/BmrU family lipid kinase
VRRVALIVNPSSGGGRARRLRPRAEARLRELGLEVRSVETRDLEHGRELARAAAGAGEIPVTLSGDGLLGAVAGALRDLPDATMGALPGGRGNDFARVTGIGLDLDAACEVIASGEPRPIDLGEIEGRTFIGIASLGFDSDANRIANEAPSALGPLVYLYGALRALAAWKHARFVVEADGERREFSGWTVAAANSKAYGGGMLLAPDARLDDGLLDVVMISRTSKARFLRDLPKVFRGAHVREPFFGLLRAPVVRIDADRPFVVYADGDPVGQLPVTVRVHAGAVRVLLPPHGS